ncbi:MAG: hypothetical protein LUF85_04305 [Bacteroides sp.]|nr:hypothetical protein [Bacteroides sp.]
MNEHGVGKEASRFCENNIAFAVVWVKENDQFFILAPETISTTLMHIGVSDTYLGLRCLVVPLLPMVFSSRFFLWEYIPKDSIALGEKSVKARERSA